MMKYQFNVQNQIWPKSIEYTSYSATLLSGEC